MRTRCAFVLVPFLVLAAGCTTTAYRAPAGRGDMLAGAPPRPADGPAGADRLLIRSGSLDITVDDVRTAARKAVALTGELDGFVQSARTDGEASSYLSLRVPSARLDEAMDALARLGTETARHVSAQDVTDQVSDLEAVLKNKKALRDRLRKLLDKADAVKDVVLVEQQLTRLQSEIDSMEGRLKNLRSRAAMSSLSVSFERRRILGPVGLALKGTAWAIEKLFVIR